MIAVRVHVALALALGVAAALDAAIPSPAQASHVIPALAACTLLAQALAFWYLPSFAKRELAAPALAEHAAPWLVAAAGLSALSPVEPLTALLLVAGLGVFGGVLLASLVQGKPWRGGVPFWRAEGHHRAGDGAAAWALASGIAWLLVAALLFVLLPVRSVLPLLAWIASLATFALGGLAHWIPRLRGAKLAARPFRAGIVAFDAGALVAGATLAIVPALGALAAFLLGGGLVLAVGVLARPEREAKPRGPRGRDAHPLLLGAAVAAVLAGLALIVGFPDAAPLVFAASELGLAALALAWCALAILGLPVVLNNVPVGRATWPAALGLASAGLLAAIAQLVPLPIWIAGVLALAGVASFVVAMSPLRKPRRDCPPQDS